MLKKTIIAVAAAAALSFGVSSNSGDAEAQGIYLNLAPPPTYNAYGGTYQPNYYGHRPYYRRCRWRTRYRYKRRCWYNYGYRKCRRVRIPVRYKHCG